MAVFEPPLRRQLSEPARESGTAVASARRGTDAPGQRLDPAVRATFQRALGHDFSDVRVHTDAEPEAGTGRDGAAACIGGSDIFFAPGHDEPHLDRGRRLLAHELVHVVQHHRAGVGVLRVSQPHDPAETEAGSAVAALGWGGLRAAYPTLTTEVDGDSGRRAAAAPPNISSRPAWISRLELTYDDGPDGVGNTARVLDALNAAGARATFYLVGKRVVQGENWRLVFDMAAGGHWLGNHAYDWNDAKDNHIFLHGTVQERAEKILQTEWAIRDALVKGRDDAQRRNIWAGIPEPNRTYIADVIAHGTGRFRTPGFRSHLWTADGTTSAAALASVNQVLAASGLRTLAITKVGIISREGVTVDPEDYVKGRTKEQITAAVTKGVSDNDESVLLHSRIAASAEATPAIVADFQKRKLTFDPTVQGTVGKVLPRSGFAGLGTISDPPTTQQISAARSFLRTKRASYGPYLSGSLAIGIFQLAQRAGAHEVDDFITEIRTTTVPTPTGPVPLANWMAVNPQWSLFLGFYENWRLAKPFPRVKDATP
jgi:peptidoglycan/xylan/chitin deacetylase (PgdA/CDA1 family)